VYEEISLNGMWELRDEVLSTPLTEAGRIAVEPEGWIAQPVPGDIHQGLVAAERIQPPLLGLNSRDCDWTEARSWWFRRTFEVQTSWLEADVCELEMQGLDANAEVFLNGVYLGSHANAFRPFALDVKPWLQPGENMLLVRLSAGVETVSELEVDHCNGVRASTEAANGRPERGEPRRIFARKPQYSWGWDWSPRLATTAIGGNVTLRVMRTATLHDVTLHPVQMGESVMVTATVTVDQFHYYKTLPGWVSVALTDAEGRTFSASAQVLLRSGFTHVDLQIPISDPLLWWPNGMGDPHRYEVTAELVMGEERVTYPSFMYGLRFLALESVDDFAVIINGRKVFAKGANWIPADAVYAGVTAERYETLVREARDANFNMLRVWGGGLYEPEAFYEACDRYGIMLWHDFMFACAPYPDDLPAFRAEVEREADYQTRRLRRHACLTIWCGSNENTWGFRDWWHERTDGGAFLYNYLLPEVVHRNCPEIPYWTSSPYGGEAPNDAATGDQHYWGQATMNPDMEVRITPETYDACDARFVSEFGYIGAPVKETVLTYLDGALFDRHGEVWQHHNNTFEKNTVDAGIRRHYVDPDTLSPDDYLLYTGLVQGLMYSYALDSMRARANCHGSLFWMFADCWGEVGWTIVDGYLRRKPSWYFVRRAYAPVRVILRPAGEDRIRAIVANDTPQLAAFDLEVGYISLDGATQEMETMAVQVPALARAEVAVFARGDHDPTQGLWVARPRERRGTVLPSAATTYFRACNYRELAVPRATLKSRVVEVRTGAEGGDSSGDTVCVIRVQTDVYAHAVHFVLPVGARPEDTYFDLLPGEAREIAIAVPEGCEAAAVSVHCVNQL
jgi:beta-mannosidase